MAFLILIRPDQRIRQHPSSLCYDSRNSSLQLARESTMPAHDWTRVETDIFHDFHLAWTAILRSTLNQGLLPAGYYALIEQHAGRMIPDVLTLHASPAPEEPPWLPPDTSGIDVAEAPRRVRRKPGADASRGFRRGLRPPVSWLRLRRVRIGANSFPEKSP